MRGYATAILAVAVALMMACAGGLPKIPDTPDDILASGDDYFARGKFFQAAELYKAYVERFPGDDRSDYGQYRLAESYFSDRQYELAAVEYRVVFSRYGYSEYVDDALFQIGVCFWNQSPKTQVDQQKTVDALGMFEQFIQTFPTNPLIPEAQEYIRRCHAKLAAKMMLTVRLYFRSDAYRAVIIYCDKIIDHYPDNEHWAEALYFKGLVKLLWGEKDEAARYFAQVIAYPDDLSIKLDAQSKLKEARK